MDSPPALDGGREGVPSQDDAKAGKVIISIRDGARGGGMVVDYGAGDVEWTDGVVCLVAAWLCRRVAVSSSFQHMMCRCVG